MNWNCKSFGLVLYVVVIFVILIPISTSKMAISTNLIFKERRKVGSTMYSCRTFGLADELPAIGE